jgi:DNA-binding transcriptional ArsR family regulator
MSACGWRSVRATVRAITTAATVSSATVLAELQPQLGPCTVPNTSSVTDASTPAADTQSGSRLPAGLDRLVGANRAALLRLLDQPLGTTHLAATCGLPVGAVGNHLRVLLDAGVVARRRSGRHVLYWRTALGESLTAADGG